MTRSALEAALAQVTQHDLIFKSWGLGERHSTGLSLAFNFAGPPGTGKTICAEAIAKSLGRQLLVVRYAELESMWMGETSKSVVNVLLQELERYTGVVIFATNLAANFDPAFERRIRTHVLFELPGETERARIWKVQLHPSRTPLAPDVDFNALAHQYEVSGGDIQNAVLKAALAAAAEPIPDSLKKIHQRHFQAGIEEVVASKRVMQQSIFAGPTVVMPEQDVITLATASQASQLLAYGLSGAALLVALIALGVALLK